MDKRTDRLLLIGMIWVSLVFGIVFFPWFAPELQQDGNRNRRLLNKHPCLSWASKEKFWLKHRAEIYIDMFRIGVLELTLPCGLIPLALIIPLMAARFYARMDKRLKNVEKKIDKTK